MRKTLILVHPGSLFGSASSLLGKYEASALREAIFHEVSHHDGGLIVIDGFLSDEIGTKEDQIIQKALQAADARGLPALRLWGCDSGERPFSAWKGFGAPPAGLVHGSQEDAAVSISACLQDQDIEVTGAWATPDHSSGCASSVLLALADILVPDRITLSETAVMEPDDDPEDGYDDEEECLELE